MDSFNDELGSDTWSTCRSSVIEVVYFLIARFLMGFACGVEWSVLPTYVAEISEDRNRGLFGTLTGAMSTAGLLVSYLVGPFVSIKYFCCVNIATLCLYYVLFWPFVPNSPYDLISNGKLEEAEQSLRKLRRTTEVQKELNYMSALVSSSNDKRVKDLFLDRGLSRALVLCITLMIIQQLSGCAALSSYAQSIFQLSGTTIPSDLAAVIIGTFSLISGLISSSLIDKLGRRILLITSCSVSSLALFSLGTYFFLLTSNVDTSALYWLPLASLITYMFSYNLGLIILPFVVVGEVFPSNVKAPAATLATLSNYSMSFVVTICFPYLVEYAGMSATFLMFGVILIIAALFCYFKLPETKGKSFKDIEIMLYSKS
ncbi:hypothetical protein GWI33_016553 [Rhynchophorus ferrugineus]|uniref:Major facilitator superfamily (MFS) profile domain-containing protein n=1 Tax=Rhynchophorus ferrugineus TaxID=354439 RepID=A0A834I0Y8_RHYFE|nr:hypothetical protein GWI33_016553 [Rhynchophorus ferrugineus]